MGVLSWAIELRFRKLMGSVMPHGLDRERWSWWLWGLSQTVRNTWRVSVGKIPNTGVREGGRLAVSRDLQSTVSDSLGNMSIRKTSLPS